MPKIMQEDEKQAFIVAQMVIIGHMIETGKRKIKIDVNKITKHPSWKNMSLELGRQGSFAIAEITEE